jgi:hypothetical protein
MFLHAPSRLWDFLNGSAGSGISKREQKNTKLVFFFFFVSDFIDSIEELSKEQKYKTSFFNQIRIIPACLSKRIK